ncbi:MAG: hypothetical protein JWR10_2805 [Rubritepida sp.]|nr:hypothetical protein [Rubritepida sp.]
MQLDYVGYLIEPICTFDDAMRYWNAAVLVTRQGGAASVRFQAARGHATEANAWNAALMHAQNLILGHVNGGSHSLAQLDVAGSSGFSA